MDIVKALNTYRKAISSDATAFAILCFLYKDGATTESDIETFTDLDLATVKGALRELYQANFITTGPKSRFALTSLAEVVLSQMGVDEIVAPSIIEDIVAGEEAFPIKEFVDFIFKVEPARVRFATRTLRNLRVFLSFSGTPSNLRPNLILNSISPRNSFFKSILDRRDEFAKSPDIMFYFSGHGAKEKSRHISPDLLDKYSQACSVSDAADFLLLNACHSSVSRHDITDDIAHHLSFRFYNYLHSEERDDILEYFVPRVKRSNKRTILAILWQRLREGFKSSTEHLDKPTPAVHSHQEFFVFIERAVADRAHNQPVMWSSLLSQPREDITDFLNTVRIENRAKGSNIIASGQRDLARFENVPLNQEQTLQLERLRNLLVDALDGIPDADADSQASIAGSQRDTLGKTVGPGSGVHQKKVKMAKHSEYFVEPHPKGWAVKLPHAERVSATASTQKAAIERAKKLAPEGVVHVKQRDGKFRRV